MYSEFWQGALSNFLGNLGSDILLGIGLGTFIAWWVGKKLNEMQRLQQREEEEKANVQKAISYLQLIQTEVKALCYYFPQAIQVFSETGWGREIQIPTPVWDVLQPSGELPKLIDPDLLGHLALFYHNLSYAKRCKDLVIDGWFVPNPASVPGMNEKLQAFIESTLTGLKDAQKMGNELLSDLANELKILDAKINKTKK